MNFSLVQTLKKGKPIDKEFKYLVLHGHDMLSGVAYKMRTKGGKLRLAK